MARSRHAPTEKTRAEVSALSSFGVEQEQIAVYLDIDKKTLTKHYRRELDTGKIKGNAAVARRLYKAAVEEGSVPAMIFWLKIQAGWREKIDVNATIAGAVKTIAIVSEGKEYNPDDDQDR